MLAKDFPDSFKISFMSNTAFKKILWLKLISTSAKLWDHKLSGRSDLKRSAAFDIQVFKTVKR